MKYLVALIASFILQVARAEVVLLPVPGEGWSLKFEAPLLTEIKPPPATSGHVYTGNAGRLNLSLHVEKPDCDGGDSPQNLYKCFGEKMQRNPYIVDGTIAAYEAPDGVQITYLMEVPVNEDKVRAFNLNYVFARNGK